MASLLPSTFVVRFTAPPARQCNNTITKVCPNGRGFGALRVSCAAKAETVQKVCDIVRKQLALPADTELTPESKFSALGADSLDTVEIVMGLEEEFGINVEEESSENITTVQEAADLIEKLVEKNTSTS